MSLPDHPTYCVLCKVIRYPDPDTGICGYCAYKRRRPPTPWSESKSRGTIDLAREARIQAEAERVEREMSARGLSAG